MIDVAAAIIEKDGLVLAARRKPGGHMAGFWEFPGGKIEAGETPQECLVRELAEELTITALVKQKVGQSIYHYDQVSVRLLAYRVEQLAGEFELIDHDKLVWLTPDKLGQLNWAPADIALVKTYQQQVQTAAFYQHHAQSYANETATLSMEEYRHEFVGHIPAGGHILDLGCGGGRDSQLFIADGYKVTAIDGSPALAALAAERIGQPVEVITFVELAFDRVFDGIWACASLLHCDKGQITPVLHKVIAALKPGGSAFISFKWGDGETIDSKGRHFNHYTEASLAELMSQFTALNIIRLWRTTSSLRGIEQRWVNVLVDRCRK